MARNVYGRNTFLHSPTSPNLPDVCASPCAAVAGGNGGFQAVQATFPTVNQDMLYSSPFPAAADYAGLPSEVNSDYYPTPTDLLETFDPPLSPPLEVPSAGVDLSQITPAETSWASFDEALQSPPSDVGGVSFDGLNDLFFNGLFPAADFSNEQDSGTLTPLFSPDIMGDLHSSATSSEAGSPLLEVKEEIVDGGEDYGDQSAFMKHLEDFADAIRSPKDESMAALSSRHRRNGRAGKIYPCLISNCGKTFTRKYNLFTHLATHNPDRPRPFECADCEKRFLRQHDLERHETVHSKAKNYYCPTPGCGRSFTRQDAVRRHLRNTRCVERVARRRAVD